MRLFPEAKFVFLWRNPLSIAASIIDTWHGGKLYVTANREDLFVGLPRLVETYAANRANVHAVRFEDLVGGDRRNWQQLMGYLGIEFDPGALAGLPMSRCTARMGDPTGDRRYSALSADPGRSGAHARQPDPPGVVSAVRAVSGPRAPRGDGV